MKKLMVVIAVVCAAAASAAWAQKRVTFAPGSSSAVVKGKTTGGPSEGGGMNPTTYVLRARAGQQMLLRLTSAKKNAVFTVYAPGTQLMEETSGRVEWSGKLPRTGDYEIIVFPRDEITNTTFTLEIAIRAASQ